LGALLISSFAHAALPPESFWAKVVKRVGPSRIIQKYNTALKSEFRAEYEKGCAQRSLEPVDMRTQILFNVVQHEAGIPRDQWLPVLPEPEADGPAGTVVRVASARPGFFTVDSSIHGFRARPYGYRRFVAHHENIHATYNHLALRMACERGAVASAGMLGGIALFMLTKGHGCASVGAGLMALNGGIFSAIGALHVTRETLKKGHEAQADREGALATNCWSCLAETAAYFRDDEHDAVRGPRGYWSAAQFGLLSEQFRAENKICSHNQAARDS
jgi:hypothetical protein